MIFSANEVDESLSIEPPEVTGGHPLTSERPARFRGRVEVAECIARTAKADLPDLADRNLGAILADDFDGHPVHWTSYGSGRRGQFSFVCDWLVNDACDAFGQAVDR